MTFWWMIFQFLYLLLLPWLRFTSFALFHFCLLCLVAGTELQAIYIQAKGLKAQMYRMSCLLKPHKLIMRSKLSFYVSKYFLLLKQAPKRSTSEMGRISKGEREFEAKHIKQLKRNLFVSTLMPSTKWNRCYN